MHCILGVKKTVKATERAAGVLNVWWREKGGRVEKKIQQQRFKESKMRQPNYVVCAT